MLRTASSSRDIHKRARSRSLRLLPLGDLLRRRELLTRSFLLTRRSVLDSHIARRRSLRAAQTMQRSGSRRGLRSRNHMQTSTRRVSSAATPAKRPRSKALTLTCLVLTRDPLPTASMRIVTSPLTSVAQAPIHRRLHRGSLSPIRLCQLLHARTQILSDLSSLARARTMRHTRRVTV